MMFSILKTSGFYTCDTSENFCGISRFISRQRNEWSSDFIGLNSFATCFHFTETDSTDSTTTSKRDIDTVHCRKLLEMFFILCDKGSEFFSWGIIDDNGNSSCWRWGICHRRTIRRNKIRKYFTFTISLYIFLECFQVGIFRRCPSRVRKK